MPLFAGLLLSKVLSLTSVPLNVIGMMFPDKEPKEALEDEMNFYCMIMSFMAVGSFLAVFLQKYCFAMLGENVTLGVRCLLYENILMKNIGWFDLRENSAGVLTSSMAQDTSIINGVSGESVGP